MKKWHVLVLTGLMVVVCAWPLIAQENQAPARQRQGGGARGGFMGGESQTQAIEAMQAELNKMKQSYENVPDRQSMQDMTQEQRTALRERFTQMREEREKSIATLENSLAQLKGTRALTQEHDEAVAKLQAVRDKAAEEGATQTAAMVDSLIAEKNKAFEDKMSSLGMEPRRGGFGGRRNQQNQ